MRGVVSVANLRCRSGWALLAGMALVVLACLGHGATLASAQTALVVSAGGPYTAIAGRSVSVSATVSNAPAGAVLTYTWLFGDGASATGNSPSHTYGAPGTFTVKVVVTASTASTDSSASKYTTVIVAGSQLVSAGGPYSGPIGQPIAFNATGNGLSQTTAFQWDFGDGTPDISGQSVTHAYGQPGSYTVAVTATDANSGQTTAGTTTATVSVNAFGGGSSFALSAGGPYTGVLNQPINFAATPSNAPFDTVYTWLFGDGSGASGQFVSHAYPTSGGFTVSLTAQSASSGRGANSTTTAIIVAGSGSGANSNNGSSSNSGSSASFTVSAGGPYSGSTGQAINVYASGTNVPNDAAYSWTFGDGGTATGPAASHSYTSSGTFNIALSVRSAGSGQSASDATTVNVAAGQQAKQSLNLSISGPSQGSTNATLNFGVDTSAGSSSGLNYSWNFGDGSVAAQGLQVQHAYTGTGTYTVTLTASTGSGGPTTTQSMQVTIGASGPGVNYPAGWNLVAGPAGTAFGQAYGALYTFQSGDSNYRTLAAGQGVDAGKGYWAYFSNPATVAFSGAGSSSASVAAPAGQWVMVGNPSATQSVGVSGADAVMAFDPATSIYSNITTLVPGQAAWAMSYQGGTITLGAATANTAATASAASTAKTSGR